MHKFLSWIMSEKGLLRVLSVVIFLSYCNIAPSFAKNENQYLQQNRKKLNTSSNKKKNHLTVRNKLLPKQMIYKNNYQKKALKTNSTFLKNQPYGISQRIVNFV